MVYGLSIYIGPSELICYGMGLKLNADCYLSILGFYSELKALPVFLYDTAVEMEEKLQIISVPYSIYRPCQDFSNRA